MSARPGPDAFAHLRAEHMVPRPDGGQSHARVFGETGPWITLLPSLGRGALDFCETYGSTIVTRLVQGGMRVLLVEPRGIGGSSGDLTPDVLTLDDLARDLLAVLDALDLPQLHVVGHAFGNRLARVLASLAPERVQTLTLLASGGGFEMSEAQKKTLFACFDLTADPDIRMQAVRQSFFARGNDAEVWREGWYPKVARAQARAALNADADAFQAGGGRPILLVQAGEDSVAPPDKAGRALKAALGDQVSYAELPHCGHALICEQPDLIAALILNHLQRA